MTKLSLRLLALSTVFLFTTVSCGGSKNLLSSGSSLMSALGGNPNLSSLTSLLKTPGLNNLLGSALKKPFTLLAPTNDALSSLGGSAIADLAKPENLSKLASMLQKHIVPGKVDAAGLMKGGLSTAAGNPLNLAGANLGTAITDKAFNLIPIDKVLQ